MKKIVINIIILLTLSIFITGCAISGSNIENNEVIEKELLEIIENQEEVSSKNDIDKGGSDARTDNQEIPPYLSLFEGLHVTGTPIDVFIEDYRLKISGAVDKELSLTFDDIKKWNLLEKKLNLFARDFLLIKVTGRGLG
jgi:DMSO/TMAO reductase YedYZ molybdopterin-dependent catalytic subunit